MVARMLGVAGGLLLAAGITAGFMPVSVGGSSCGFAFHSAGFDPVCVDAVSDRRAGVFTLLIVGGVAGFSSAGAVSWQRGAEAEAARRRLAHRRAAR